MSSVLRGRPALWQDRAILALAALLFVSPWLLGYAGRPVASWNAQVLALAFIFCTVAAVGLGRHTPHFVTAFLAFWLAVSPRILAVDAVPATVAAAVGVAVCALGLWSGVARARSRLERKPAVPPVEPPAPPPTKRAA